MTGFLLLYMILLLVCYSEIPLDHSCIILDINRAWSHSSIAPSDITLSCQGSRLHRLRISFCQKGTIFVHHLLMDTIPLLVDVV